VTGKGRFKVTKRKGQSSKGQSEGPKPGPFRAGIFLRAARRELTSGGADGRERLSDHPPCRAPPASGFIRARFFTGVAARSAAVAMAVTGTSGLFQVKILSPLAWVIASPINVHVVYIIKGETATYDQVSVNGLRKETRTSASSPSR